ncbi:hypothetical protein D9M68_763710 [compost metagenome]
MDLRRLGGGRCGYLLAGPAPAAQPGPGFRLVAASGRGVGLPRRIAPRSGQPAAGPNARCADARRGAAVQFLQPASGDRRPGQRLGAARPAVAGLCRPGFSLPDRAAVFRRRGHGDHLGAGRSGDAADRSAPAITNLPVQCVCRATARWCGVLAATGQRLRGGRRGVQCRLARLADGVLDRPGADWRDAAGGAR